MHEPSRQIAHRGGPGGRVKDDVAEITSPHQYGLNVLYYLQFIGGENYIVNSYYAPTDDNEIIY